MWPADSPLTPSAGAVGIALRIAEVDQSVLANLLRLNQARAR